MYITPFQFQCLIVKVLWHLFLILSDSPTANASCMQVIKEIRRAEETVHVKFMTYPFYSPIQTSLLHV